MINRLIKTRGRVAPHDVFRPLQQKGPTAGGAFSLRERVQIPVVFLVVGGLTGFAEAAVLAVQDQFLADSILGRLQLNRHFVWMSPLAYMVLFGLVGLALAACSFILRCGLKRPSWRVAIALAALAFCIRIPGVHPLAACMLAAGIGARLGGRLAQVGARHDRLLHRLFVVVAAGIAVTGGLKVWEIGMSEQRGLAALPAQPPGAPNIVLIVLDTVRADRMSVHGYHRDTTPNLRRHAEKRAITFEFARAPAPWTLPSHATLFTARWPHETRLSRFRPLDESFLTIAEWLRDHGYATSGVVSNAHFLNTWFGLAQGFLHFEDFPERDSVNPLEVLRNAELGRRLLAWVAPRASSRPEAQGIRKAASEVNQAALDWIDTFQNRKPARSFFLFLNYMDAHDPYILPDGESPRFGRQTFTQDQRTLLRDWSNRSRDSSVDVLTRAFVSDQYDNCLFSLDRQIGLLMTALEVRGLAENTWVIITSDHGEHLGEHDLFLHGQSLYRPIIDVPLMVIPPSTVSIGPRRIPEAVTLRDLPATIHELAQVQVPCPFPGQSLARFWMGSPEHEGAKVVPAFSEGGINAKALGPLARDTRIPVSRGPMQSLAIPGLTYIRLGDGSEQLFDLMRDPGEADNRADAPEYAEILGRLRGYLGRGHAAGRPSANP